ncbi:MAG: hypothetical protein M1819_003257 [Sarea resinae]|nr:MAG: hypothetical protein M1819_003257 [Sarea resinae]
MSSANPKATTTIIDDKTAHCLPFILDRLAAHQERHRSNPNAAPPFFLGLNGVQGIGKTTLVTTLHQTLTTPPHSLPTTVLSIDDLYLPHAAQKSLARSHPTNSLIQHRGEPGTHDLPLAQTLFHQLSRRERTKIPRYDKSAFNGEGDRADESTWEEVNGPGQPQIEVVIFEGWCVGFRALSPDVLRAKWEEAVREEKQGEGGPGMLGKLKFQDVEFVNEALRGYDPLTDSLDALIHLDAEDTHFVYQWRLEQEAALRATKGSGMNDEQVVEFVNGYYPAYELFTDTLRAGISPGDKGRQLRIVAGRDRKVQHVIFL